MLHKIIQLNILVLQYIIFVTSDLGGTRTLNPQNRNLIFYPLNYETAAKITFFSYYI